MGLLMLLIGAFTRRNSDISRSRFLFVCSPIGFRKARLDTMKKRRPGQMKRRTGQKMGTKTHTSRIQVGLSSPDT
jgi:hypothetical protein